MPLSNKNLMEISHFAMTAKKHIGNVKASDMLSDSDYACDVLIKASLSDDYDLVQLSKKIGGDFNFSLIQAVEDYIMSLRVKRHDDEYIHASKYFLGKLSHHLHHIKPDSKSYRDCVECFLNEVDTKEKDFCIHLARTFYHFWVTVNKNSATSGSVNNVALSAQHHSIEALWNHLDEELMTDAETWSLEMYEQAMKKLNVPDIDIDVRKKIAKVILLELRKENEASSINYRAAVSNIHSLFINQEMKEFFLIVSRELYQFIAEDVAEIPS